MNDSKMTKFYTPKSAIEKLQGLKSGESKNQENEKSKVDFVIGNPPYTHAKNGSAE